MEVIVSTQQTANYSFGYLVQIV